MNTALLRVALGATAAIAAGLTASAVTIFLGGVVYLELAKRLPEYAAAVIAAGVALIMVAGLCSGAMNLRCLPRGKRPSVGNTEEALGQQIARLFGSEAVAVVKAHPQMSTLAALLTGIAAGSNPDLRRLLRAFLEPVE